MDMRPFVTPKSNQLNADDLMSGPVTVRIAHVTGTGNADQPVAVYFDGDDGRPFLPCKSMRRVMIAAWGVDASQYVGRLMTLYRDPKVAFGGMEVGGIRISHMSHIDRPLALALTVTKAKRATYKVSPITNSQHEAPPGAGPGGGGSLPHAPAAAPNDAWSSTRDAKYRIPLSDPVLGSETFFADVPTWCAHLAGMMASVEDPMGAWEANLTTHAALVKAAKTDAAKTALSGVADAIRAHHKAMQEAQRQDELLGKGA